MTRIAKSLGAALIAAPLAFAGAASAQAPMGYETMMDRLMIRQAVTDAVIDYYNSTEVVEDTSPGDPMQDALLSGQPIPEGVEMTDVPADMAAVLPSVAGAEWMAVGNHLVAVADGVAAVVVWEVLP